MVALNSKTQRKLDQTLIKLAPPFWLSEHILLSTQADSVGLKQLKFSSYFEILCSNLVLDVKHGQKIGQDDAGLLMQL